MIIKGVRFNCSTGDPKIVECQFELRHNKTLGNVIEVTGGVTGYESFCLGGGARVHVDKMVAHGWWACAGTPGRWDGLYFSGLQMKWLFSELKKVGVE